MAFANGRSTGVTSFLSYRIKACAIGACLLASSVSKAEDKLIFYPPDNPPWGSSQDNSGFVIEAVTTALKRAEIDHELIYVPWKRAQQQVEKSNNGLMAPITRLSHREHKYNWIAPINISYLRLVTLDKVLADANWKELLTIPVVARRESPAEFLLVDLNFDSVTIVENEIKAARMLIARRVLLWMQRGVPGNWAYHQIGEKTENLKTIATWQTPLQYLVGSKGIDTALIKKIADELTRMKQTGEIDKIKESHVPFPINCEHKFSCSAPQEQ